LNAKKIKKAVALSQLCIKEDGYKLEEFTQILTNAFEMAIP